MRFWGGYATIGSEDLVFDHPGGGQAPELLRHAAPPSSSGLEDHLEDPKDQKASKPDVRFAEVNSTDRTRGKDGRWKSLGASVESREVREVRRAAEMKNYRRFLESVEPAALRVMAQALKDGKVAMKDRILIAQDILNRLHGKTLQPVEAEEARRRVEQMSTDELREYVGSLAAELGLNVPVKVVN